MFHLLTRPTGRTRRAFTAVTRAVRSVVTPAALVAEQASAEPVTAPDPADVYTADELPAVADVEAAAAQYAKAAEQARRADRGKRAAKKTLGRIPAGLYGGWLISRAPSSRQTADLDAIRATYARLGLGPVPMKASAPSLKVERVTELADLATTAA